MPRKNCRYCDQPVNRTQSSVECTSCHLLSHRECTNLDYYAGPSAFSCCLQPLAQLHNPASGIPQPSLVTKIISQPNTSDLVYSSSFITPLTAISTTAKTEASLTASDTSSKRKHSHISSSPPQQVSKLARVIENHSSSNTSSQTIPIMTQPAEPPPYWTELVNEVRALRTANENNTATLGNIHQAIVESNLQRQREREEDRQDIEALKAHAALSDRCEVVIFGLPVNSSLTYPQAAQKLITSLSLPISVQELTFREWSVPIRNHPSIPSNSLQAPYKAFVIRFPNPYARDRLLESSLKLRSLKAGDIFGEGGNIVVYVQPLWPSEVHTLFTLAIRASKSYNYARSIVVNLVVCLRESIRSRPIPIYSEQDLHRILPPTQSHPPARPFPQVSYNQVNQTNLTSTSQHLQNQAIQSQSFQFNPIPFAQTSVSTYPYINYPMSSTIRTGHFTQIQPQQPGSITPHSTPSIPVIPNIPISAQPLLAAQTLPSVSTNQTSSTLVPYLSLPQALTPPASMLFTPMNNPSIQSQPPNQAQLPLTTTPVATSNPSIPNTVNSHSLSINPVPHTDQPITIIPTTESNSDIPPSNGGQ